MVTETEEGCRQPWLFVVRSSLDRTPGRAVRRERKKVVALCVRDIQWRTQDQQQSMTDFLTDRTDSKTASRAVKNMNLEKWRGERVKRVDSNRLEAAHMYFKRV